MKETWHSWYVETREGIADEGRARIESDGWRYAQRVATVVLTENPHAEVHLYVGTDVITVKPGRLWETTAANRVEVLAVLRSTCAARIAACY
ncbi:hypothetical protein [Lentzea sp. NBRC 102530]|uniref:hypothetical protein n=1 Tax=Lentzea sp. NBRC 102530 TaxID=3032201 RepID=UPI0024A48270|nr:hypothetical protein [Lentzea sp. NBRC 102530]GLY51316.1 hypothetical protein Lesp01_49720 [Lentzea sp. NBRC 102530]